MIFPCLQGSKAQLEQVWEETDGLEAKDFNPKTFFKLHGMCYGRSIKNNLIHSIDIIMFMNMTFFFCRCKW